MGSPRPEEGGLGWGVDGERAVWGAVWGAGRLRTDWLWGGGGAERALAHATRWVMGPWLWVRAGSGGTLAVARWVEACEFGKTHLF